MHCAVVLFSGGLDSMLAIRILQEQGLEVEALNIRTIFSCCQASAAQTAHRLGARLTVLPVPDDYIDVIRNPRYGYGKGTNPCVDCRAYMARMAKRFMEEVGACVVATGEILGQRPMSQKRHQLGNVERLSGLEGRLLRPLSAKLLPPTIPESEGLIDREKLYDFSGRMRRPLIDLAVQLGIEEARVPGPSTGCALTEPMFAVRVTDLMQHCPQAGRWDFELLNYGRHFRLNENCKLAMGRNAQQNAAIRLMAARDDATKHTLIMPENFRGPDTIILGEVTSETLALVEALVLRYCRGKEISEPLARLRDADGDRVVAIVPDEDAEYLRPM